MKYRATFLLFNLISINKNLWIIFERLFFGGEGGGTHIFDEKE